jgi:hypothetical protein
MIFRVNLYICGIYTGVLRKAGHTHRINASRVSVKTVERNGMLDIIPEKRNTQPDRCETPQNTHCRIYFLIEADQPH